MTDLLEFFEGKKTYLIAFCIFLLGGFHAMGWVADGTYNAVLPILGAGGLAGLRASKTKKK